MKKVLLLILCLLLYPLFIWAQGCVDINTATLTQLDTLTGIGPVYAQHIIDGRPYSSVDELDRVKGIGPATLAKIKTQGLASVVCGMSDVPQTKSAESGTPLASATYPTGAYINEILPNPAGSDETDEWIELHNSNSADIDLSGWQLQDTAGTITTYTVPADTKLLTNNYLTFKRPETKIMLNNDEDGINLLTPDGKIVDSVNFSRAPLGQSYNKTASGWSWSTTLTPGLKNILTTLTKTPSVSSKPNGLPKKENSVTNDGVEIGLADLSRAVGKNQIKSPWFLFFTVLATTIVLAITVLFVKVRLENKKN